MLTTQMIRFYFSRYSLRLQVHILHVKFPAIKGH